MFKKLDGILEKYQKLSAEMADPAVIAQTERWTQCAKEHADIAETAEKYLEYRRVEREMEEDFAAAEQEEDREMKDLLTQEGYACKEKLAAIRGELRVLLLPKDKNDERNVVMEIRGGAGGEERGVLRRRGVRPERRLSAGGTCRGVRQVRGQSRRAFVSARLSEHPEMCAVG